MPPIPQRPITVSALNQRLSNAIAYAPDVRDVWLSAETSDVRTSGGHCYMELVEKNEDGTNKSRIRATIWAGVYRKISEKFRMATRADITSNIKVLVRVSASYHPTYGMSVNITDIDPSYTLGDAQRLRAEIINRLTVAGIINNNKRLAWPLAPNRIAIISARGAAGYDDFITHLYSSQNNIVFDTTLFEAVMQGERTVPTVLQALNLIKLQSEDFDAVVIIRGGGATTDLQAFDNYELAEAIALFPIPVIIGIGHERDTSVLDSVANLRVKTPTAAAEFLIDRINRILEALQRASEKIYQAAAQRIADNRQLLAQASASIPGYANAVVQSKAANLQKHALTISSLVSNAVTRRKERLNRYAADIIAADYRQIEKSAQQLTAAKQLLEALSPQKILNRGFSYTTMPDGTILRDPEMARPGTIIITHLAQGTLKSTVNK